MPYPTDQLTKNKVWIMNKFTAWTDREEQIGNYEESFFVAYGAQK